MDKPVSAEEIAEKEVRFCDTQIDFLAHVLTISTLILGFNLTGTFLSVQFTGSESYTNEHVISMFEMGAGSAVCSAASVALSMTLYAHSKHAYGFKGPSAACAFLHKVLLIIFFSEILMLASIVAFFDSFCIFVEMNFVGPDICPNRCLGRGEECKLRESSFCALLGGDLHEAAQRTCAGFDSKVDDKSEPDWRLCITLEYYDQHKKHPYYFGWGTSKRWSPEGEYDWDSESRLRMVDEAANSYCQKSVIEKTMKDNCRRAHDSISDPLSLESLKRRSKFAARMMSSMPGSSQQQQACDEAYTAFMTAERCVDDTTLDAHKCFSVCHWPFDQKENAYAHIKKRFVWVRNILIGILGVVIIARGAQYVELARADFSQRHDA